MSLNVIRAVIFIALNIAVIVHAKRHTPFQSDANAYLTCLQSSRESLTCDVSSFLDDFTNLVLQTDSKVKVNSEFGELEDLDYNLESFFQEINFDDFEEGGLLTATKLMSQCLRKHSYHEPEFVDVLSSFIGGLKEKAASTESYPTSYDSENVPLTRYNGTKDIYRSQSPRRRVGSTKVPLSNKPASTATYNYKNLKQDQSYDEEKNSIPSAEPISPVYSSFASSFFENIANSRPLQRLFKSIMMTTLARKNFYRAFYRASKMFSIPNPEMFASTVALAVGETFHSLTPCSLINIVGNSVGQYLWNARLLDKENYSNLAAQLAHELNESLANIPIQARDVYLIQNLATGIVSFLYSLELFTPRNAPLFARYLANEFLFTKDNPSVCKYRAIQRFQTEDTSKEDDPLKPNMEPKREEDTKFSTILIKRLTTSDVYPKKFYLQLSAEDAYKVSYEYIHQLASSLGSSYPDDIATKIADAISSSLNGVKWYSFANIVAISLEKFLSEHLFLTADNAEELVEAYLGELNKVLFTSPLSSYIDLFFETTYHFLTSQFFLGTKNTNSFGTVFINELKSVEPFESPALSSIRNSSSVKTFLWNNFPEIYSPNGLTSEKAFDRVGKITINLARHLWQTAGIDMDYFAKLFLNIASNVHSDNSNLEAEGLALETLLEMISALLQIIQNSSILKTYELSEMNLALAKSFIKEIF